MNLCSIPNHHPVTPTYARTARDTRYGGYTRRVKIPASRYLVAPQGQTQTDKDLCETQATAKHYRVPRGTLLKCIWRRHHLYKKTSKRPTGSTNLASMSPLKRTEADPPGAAPTSFNVHNKCLAYDFSAH